MTRIYQRSKWPKDTAERIIKMREAGKTWSDIAYSFRASTAGVIQKARKIGIPMRALRRFTPEEDAAIREGYLANANLDELAASMGRKRGDIYQRILRRFPEIINTVRTVRASRAINKYGRDFLALAHTPDEAAQELRQRLLHAKASARVSAMEAKANRSNALLTAMTEQIAAGKHRNRAIFEARMAGLSLQQIGDYFDVTRERIRQICDAEAFSVAMEREHAA